MLSPQVTQGDTGGGGLDADGENLAVGVIDAQKDLAPPGAFILLLYLAQLKQNVLGQQLSAQGSQAGRGQAQPGRKILARHGAVVVQQL